MDARPLPSPPPICPILGTATYPVVQPAALLEDSILGVCGLAVAVDLGRVTPHGRRQDLVTPKTRGRVRVPP